jgi:ABC-type branched-subunit amino acid transport system substrate-binding protein
VFFDDTIPFAGDITADVARMKQKGVQLVSTCLDSNEVLKLAKTMKVQGLHAIQNLLNAYDHDFIRENGALFEGSFIESQYVPWETKPQSLATQQYLAGIKAVVGDPHEVTEMGWILAKELVDGLKGAGPEFTQQKVIDYLNAQTAYDADGLIPPIDWTTGHVDPQTHPDVRANQECLPVMRIEQGRFVPYETPNRTPWTCLDTNKDASQPAVYRSFAPGTVG